MPRAVTWLMLAALSVAPSATSAQPRARTAPSEPPRPAATPLPPRDAGMAAVPADGALSARNASYSIDVSLDPQRRRLTGREVITWRNISPISTSEFPLHLYWNAWRNTDSTWLREAALAATGREQLLRHLRENEWGWSTITAVRLLGSGAAPPIDLTGTKRFIAPDDGNAEDRTVAVVALPAPVAPGETINLEVEWTAQVPRTFARTGGIGDFFFLAQWFPKVAVLEADGWNAHQFHVGTEFYSDYGVYDVRMRVPTGWIVGATGTEQSRRDNNDGTTTHRYAQADVHDFAWTTSPNYQEHRARFTFPGLPSVDMRLLLQPEHAGQVERHFGATRAALRYYGEWYGPYPYGHITIVDPAWQSGAGGMEYPTLFTAGTRWLVPSSVTQPEGVTVHEAGHQFWYGIVGNNEFEHAWLDEGLTTFSTARVIEQVYTPNFLARRFFGGFVPWVFRDIPLSRASDGNGLAGYRGAAESDAQSTPSWRYFPSTGSTITYSKTALWLHTLEKMIGWPALQRGMALHFQRSRFTHPTPEAFFRALDEAAGRDLTWYFDQVYRGSDEFDYGVTRLTSNPARTMGFVEKGTTLALSAEPERPATTFDTTVVVRRFGEAIFPVDVEVRFEDGSRVRERWPGRERWKAFTYERPSRATSAIVDPDRVLLLDVNTTNNSSSLSPAGGRAATKWSMKWLVWLQDLLMTYAFFV